MNTSSINRDAYHFGGSNMVDTGAVRQEEYRLKRIFAEGAAKAPKKQSPLEWLDEHEKKVLEPRRAHLLSLGTGQSKAHVSFEGRSYTLPPVSRSQTEHGIDFESQFSGLGATNGFRQAFEASLKNVYDQQTVILKQNADAEKKSKSLFSKKSKPFQKLEMPKKDTVFTIFNAKLAESRVALRIQMDSVGNRMVDEFFYHPSSASGDLVGEMKAWSDAHWKGVPEVQNRDWSKEIITSLPVKYIPG